MSASPNGPCPYPGELSVTVYSSKNSVTGHFLLHVFFSRPTFFHPSHSLTSSLCSGVSGITESWGLKLLCYLLCLQGSDTEEKESQSSVTSSPNDKQIDPALWLWQSKQG